MNTDKTLRDKFASNIDGYPVWYYKQIKEIEVDDVIFNLLKETFVVELNGKKIVMTFGKNRKHEIGCTQSCNEGLDYTSYKTIRKAFTEGKWFRITEEDTTDEFKEQYNIDKDERYRQEERKFMIDMLNRAVELSEVDDATKEKHYQEIKLMSDEKLKELTEILFSQFKQ